jgi:hypothetical protein
MAQHLQVALLGLAAVDGRRRKRSKSSWKRGAMNWRSGSRSGLARNAKQVRAHHVHLQDGGVERQHEIADRRQQVDIVEPGLLGIVAPWPVRARAPCRPRRRRPPFPAAQRA